MADDKKDNTNVTDNKEQQNNNQNEEVLTDIKIDNRETQVVATVNINSIFTSLHEEAYKKAQAKVGNIEIVNSAVNDKGKFLGPGPQVIIAQSKSDDLTKVDCLTAIKEYVQWFCGPDLAEVITLDYLTPLTRPKTDEEKNKSLSNSQNDSETKNNEEVSKSEEDSKSEDKSSESEDQQKAANESLETYIYKIDSNLFNILFESTQQQDEEEANSKGLKITGYQVEYQLDIPGQKPSTNKVVDALKNVGKYFGKGLLNQIGGLGFQSWDWRTGSKGENYKLGDIAKKVSKAVVKSISPDKLVSAVKAEFSKRFKGNSIQLIILDSKSIENHLSKRLSPIDRDKIRKIPNALCIKVSKNDKYYELINKKAIVTFVKAGLSRIKEHLINLNFKSWQKITENDVIFINNYSDQHYNKDSTKHGQVDANAKKIKTKEENYDADVGISNESVKNVFDIYKMIFENIDLYDVENYITEQLLIEGRNKNRKKGRIPKAQRQKARYRSSTAEIQNNELKLKTAIMPIKFRYIKFRIDKLKENGYYKPEGKFVDFEVPENQNILDFIINCKNKSYSDTNDDKGNFTFTEEIYNELANKIPITDEEVKKFEGFSQKDFEQVRNNTLNSQGKPTYIALQKLFVEVYSKVDNIKAEKTKEELFPGINDKKELYNKLNDKDSDIWDLSVIRMFDVLDDISQKEIDREGNKRALDKTKTGKDLYIIPIKGINIEYKK